MRTVSGWNEQHMLYLMESRVKCCLPGDELLSALCFIGFPPRGRLLWQK